VNAVGADRQAVIDWLFSVRNRQSVLGEYSIDRYGDPTLRDFGSIESPGDSCTRRALFARPVEPTAPPSRRLADTGCATRGAPTRCGGAKTTGAEAARA
jgi:hypothetical protein